ncbi:hypothetical protein D4R99_04960 [bacterium]|nr:MAG: hypothetical protein D4R99_04960 [bacterium]
MTPEVKTALLRLLEIKHKLYLSGGASPFSRLYTTYQQEQRFVLGVFGLPDTNENFHIFNQSVLGFDIDEMSQVSGFDAPFVYDGTSRSVFRESGRRFLVGTRGVHLRTIDEQAEKLFTRLYTKANKHYGRGKGED